MLELLALMTKPFLACVILVGIHAYLGWHVIEREIIFVDLALAQIAALGAAIALIAGFAESAWGNYLITLGFTFLGAIVFSFSGTEKSKIPQEAVIGIVYAGAASMVILILNFSPSGDEHLKHFLTGNLLFVSWSKITMLIAIYGLIGIIHWKMRKPFLMLSQDRDKAKENKINIRFYDFIFYALFGVVVTTSVQVAGVLLVFCFLIIPAGIGVLCASTLISRLMVGWGAGIFCSFFGCFLSAWADIPTGPSIVAVLVGLFFSIFLVNRINA